MQFSFHIQQMLTQCHTQLVHGTEEGHATSLILNELQFDGLLSIGIFPAPNSTQTSCLAGRVSATITGNTTTSVSTVHTSI